MSQENVLLNEVENLVVANDKLRAALADTQGELDVARERLEVMKKTEHEKTQHRTNLLRENERSTTRADMLEKAMRRAAGIVDSSVHILFGERIGQQELASDPAFKAFKYLREAVEIKEIGKPNTMSQDFKPEILK